MSKLPVISGADCMWVLQRRGFVLRAQQGSHIILVRETPKTRLSVPNHRELDRGTLRAIIREAGLSVEELVNDLQAR